MLQDTFAVKKILMHNDYDPIIIINDIGKYFIVVLITIIAIITLLLCQLSVTSFQ